LLLQVGTDVLKNRQPPRLIKHHLPQSVSPHHPEAKHIVVVRNPFDVFISWVHAKREVSGVGCEDVDTLLHRFLSGDLEYGCNFEHLFSWYAKRGGANVLLVHYERIKEDFRTVVLEIARFLDVPGVVKRLDQCLVDKLREVTSFKNLLLTVTSSDDAVNTSQKPGKRLQHTLFREGVAGNWARHLTVDQETRLRRIYTTKQLPGPISQRLET
ncbi:cytosolic sulfotransferase, putative, partial [Ixodes scapularis]